MGFISPSALSTFQACQLRLAFQRDTETQAWKRKSTTSALGVVAHSLTELVLTGAAPPSPADRRTWLIEQWGKLLHAQWKSIQEQWPDRTVEDPKHWAGEVATRVRLIRRLQGLAVPAHPGQAGAVSAGSDSFTAAHEGDAKHPPLPWIERKLYDQERGLFGQPDRVEEVNGTLRVVDLKSGLRQVEMTTMRLQQLLLYAHLVRVSAGRLPDQVALQDVRGSEQTCAVSADEVAGVVASATSARAIFNSHVARGDFAASPSEEACASCPFRVVCTDYWDARTADWPGNTLRGTVIAVSSHGLEVAPFEEAMSKVGLVGQGMQDAVEGNELVAVDLTRAGPGVFQTRWNSAIRWGHGSADGRPHTAR